MLVLGEYLRGLIQVGNLEGLERVSLSLKYEVLSKLGKGQQGAFRAEERRKKSWLNNANYRIILLFWPRVVVYFGFLIS